MDAANFASSFTPLWVTDRGGVPDAVRLGAYALVDPAGGLVASAGDPSLVAFLRSSAKPFQAVAFLRRGLDERLGLDAAEIACACASHEGEDKHVRAARRILAASGADEKDLLCGTHAASSRALERKVLTGEVQLGAIHNNCSGKHAAMLAVCRAEGWPAGSYPERDHPLQRENLETLAAFAGVDPSSITVATDNCTVPTFALPLTAAARAFARLLEPDGLPDELARAGMSAARAMRARPDMVGGARRLDTALMELTRGRLLVKTGANGYYAAAGPRASGGGSALGLALKLSGAEAEAQKAPVVIGTLAATGLLSPAESEELLARFDAAPVNCRGAVVGGGGWVGPR